MLRRVCPRWLRAFWGGFISFTITTSVIAQPSVTTNSPQNIGTTSARLTGFVNPNGLQTNARFEWGPTMSYGNLTPVINLTASTTGSSIIFDLAGLVPSTTYHYRATATNSGGTANGANQSFTTAAIPPSATTDPAEDLTPTSARLVGTVNPNGASTTARFQWGTTVSYGNQTTIQSLGSGTSGVQTTFDLSGLSPNTTYHFRVTATNSGGTTNGSNRSFTTPPLATPPTVSTLEAAGIGTNEATLSGTVNPNGSATSVRFEWGETQSYGNLTPPTDVGSGGTPVLFTFTITGLSRNTSYHYRIVASNIGGVSNGTNRSFTTLLTTPVPALTRIGGILLVILLLGGMIHRIKFSKRLASTAGR